MTKLTDTQLMVLSKAARARRWRRRRAAADEQGGVRRRWDRALSREG